MRQCRKKFLKGASVTTRCLPMKKNYDVIVVGAGFAGATAARRFADAGRSVLLLERRDHIGGNAYDCPDDAGVLIHKYGPHIFHTNSRRVYDFLCRFGSFSDYSHKVAARIGDQLIPVPFNFNSIDKVFGGRADALRQKLLDRYSEGQKIPVFELTVQDDPDLQELADYVYRNVFKYYTEKQWGVPMEQVSRETLSRVPVLLSRDDRYFQDTYQGMPSDGYTALIENMLDHELIEVVLSCDAATRLALDGDRILLDGVDFAGQVIYSGPADELFGNKYGALPYRTLDFKFETHNVDKYQPYGTVNYTVSEAYTRITEFKILTGQKLDGVTTIMKEYSRAYEGGADIPYYAILDPENLALYEKYASETRKSGRFHLLGRLAEYRYYNMDATVEKALALCDALLK